MVVYEKIYFEEYTNDQYIWYKNNIAQLCFILGRAKLCFKFSSWLRDTADIYRFPIMHMVKTYCLLENLRASLGILELTRYKLSSDSKRTVNLIVKFI